MKQIKKGIYSACLISVSFISLAQTSGDLRSNLLFGGSGNWNDINTWERYNGTTWDGPGTGSNNPAQIPSASNNVYIQSGNTIILQQNESCYNLHICADTSSGTNSAYQGNINLQSFSLTVNGKLRCYYGKTGTIPGTSSTGGYANYPFLASSGKISFVGNSRTIFNSGEWGATIISSSTGTFPLEINMNSAQTATSAVNLKISSLNVSAGIFDVGSKSIGLDNGTTGQGDATIAAGATLSSGISSASGNVFQRTGTTIGGILTVNGTLILSGVSPSIAMSTISFNGNIIYSKSASQTLAAASNSGADPVIYNNLILSGTGTKTTLDSKATTVNGILSLQGTAAIATGISGTLIYGANGTLEYAGSSGQSVATSPVEWPSSGGPTNLCINNSSGVTLNTTKTISGTVTLKSGTFNANSNFTISSSGSLIYNGGTISNYTLPSQLNNFSPNTGTTILSGNLIVSGLLNLANNKLDIGSNTLIINDITITTGSIKSNGTGSLIINGNGNLSCNLLFDQTISGTTNRLQNFTLNRGTSISSGSVTLGNTLEIAGTLTLTNGTLNTGGTLTLVSNVSGTARIGFIPGTADISGNVKVQRYVPAIARQYRMFSPTTSSFTFNDIIDNIFVSGPGGSTNGFDNSTLNSNTIYTYQETTGGTGRGWQGISAITNTLSAGQGALVFVRGDRTLTGWYTSPFPAQNTVTIDFNGAINKGTISPTITFTSTSDTSADGWNLTGNPYPSQIDWSTVTTTGLDGNFWILDPSTGSYYGNNSGIIASGQAFFIHAISCSPSITFTESCKASGTAGNFFKTVNPKLTIKMVKDSVHSDITNIEFATGASKNYIATEDIVKMYNSSINFGFIADNGVNVQNNVVPFVSATSDTFNLFTSASSGTYHFDFTGQSSITTNYSIYLIDNFTNTIQDIRTTAIYSFSITSNPLSSGDNRFKIIFQNPTLLPVKLLNFTAVKIPNTSDVLLKWSSSSELNNDRFIIERADDGIHFSDLSAVKANGNINSLANYSFIDNGILAKNDLQLFYKLRQIGKNGAITFSEIVSIKQDEKKEPIILYPNPAKQQLNIQFAYAVQGTIHAEVYNSIGVLSISKDIIITEGQNSSMDIHSLSEGMYILKTEHSATGERSIIKFTKE